MGSIALKIEQYLLALSGPWVPWCLALVAAADSSFLSLIEVNDLLIVVLTVKHPENMLLYCGFTTAGSVAGCWLMFRLGQKGGELFLARRFAEEQIHRVGNLQKKYGFLALVVSSILPPPTPFKLVVLTAGALKTPVKRFLFSMILGRSCRYFAAGVLALLYGELAWTYLRQHYFVGSCVAVGVILAGVVFLILARKSSFLSPTGN